MSASKSYDILVLGATGFTGKLVTRYLYAHPRFRSQFSFAVGARSPKKLDELAEELSLDKEVKRVQVDVTENNSLLPAVQASKVVINTVGPYWKWGTPVVRACVQAGVHYVDLTGETFWIHHLIREFDYAASQTGAIIIPSSGFDSIPSDIAAFLSNKALKQISPEAEMGESVSAIDLSGGISGGTLSTAIEMLDNVPREILQRGKRDYCNSPIQGVRSPRMKLLYQLPHIQPSIYGSPWFMQPVNRRLVQRTWGLAQARLQAESPSDEVRKLSYGPKFTYDEFWQSSSKITALISGVLMSFALLCFATLKPVRWLVSRLLPPGSGPSEKTMQNGYLNLTNISSSSNLSPPVVVKTVIRAKGDPGYLLTGVMIAESALSLLLHYDSLPPYAKKGGILTPMGALGDVLIQRLEESGRFEFDYGHLVNEKEGKKTR